MRHLFLYILLFLTVSTNCTVTDNSLQTSEKSSIKSVGNNYLFNNLKTWSFIITVSCLYANIFLLSIFFLCSRSQSNHHWINDYWENIIVFLPQNRLFFYYIIKICLKNNFIDENVINDSLQAIAKNICNRFSNTQAMLDFTKLLLEHSVNVNRYKIDINSLLQTAIKEIKSYINPEETINILNYIELLLEFSINLKQPDIKINYFFSNIFKNITLNDKIVKKIFVITNLFFKQNIKPKNVQSILKTIDNFYNKDQYGYDYMIKYKKQVLSNGIHIKDTNYSKLVKIILNDHKSKKDFISALCKYKVKKRLVFFKYITKQLQDNIPKYVQEIYEFTKSYTQNPNVRHPKHYYSTLTYALYRWDLEMIEYLFNNNADIHQIEKETRIHFAQWALELQNTTLFSYALCNYPDVLETYRNEHGESLLAQLQRYDQKTISRFEQEIPKEKLNNLMYIQENINPQKLTPIETKMLYNFGALSKEDYINYRVNNGKKIHKTNRLNTLIY